MKIMNQLLAGTIFLLSTQFLFAHGDDDWSTDKEAFKSAKYIERDSSFANFAKIDSLNFLSDPQNYQDYGVDIEFFKEKLAQFSGAAEVDINGQVTKISERRSSRNRQLSRQFLKQEFEALGFQVKLQNYGDGANVIAEKKGTSEKILIISAHMDSVGNAGANDDGTGVIAGLAIAKALAEQNFEHTLQVIAFDQEERGLVGSRHYVRSISGNSANILGDIQMEMLGTNSRGDGGFHVIDCDKASSSVLTREIMNAVEALSLPLQRVSACTERSDHSAFWDVGIPAVALSENFFGGDSDPCYHQSCDVFDDRLNYDYMENIVRALTSATANILNPDAG